MKNQKDAEVTNAIPFESSTAWADGFETEIRHWRGVALSSGDDSIKWGPLAYAVSISLVSAARRLQLLRHGKSGAPHWWQMCAP